MVEIWALEVCNHSAILYCTLGNLYGVKELRELGLCENEDSWRPEYYLIHDGACNSQGSTSNVSGPDIRCSEKSGVFEFGSLAPARVPSELNCQFPTTAAAEVPVNGPTDELIKIHHLLRRRRERGRDLRTREARVPPSA